MKDFNTYIREYSTKNIISFFADESIKIWKEQVKQNSNSCATTYPLEVFLYGYNLNTKTIPVTIYAWEIPDIAYSSIIHSNDYRKKAVSINNSGVLVNSYRGSANDNSRGEYLEKAKLSDLFKYVTGMTIEQFRYEDIGWCTQNFNRNYHMLLGSKSITRDEILNINEVVQKTFGMDVDELLTAEMFLLWICSKDCRPLNVLEAIYPRKKDSKITKEKIEKIIKYYSVTYEEVREDTLGKQKFYSKPFVCTQSGHEYILISYYLVQMVFADGLYWLMRDYYLNNKGGQAFMNAFGKMFEEYFEELGTFYLQPNCLHKISEGKCKGADYYVEFENAVFIFELKSGLMRIGAKQQVPNIDQINQFCKRNILEAYEQLKESEKSYNGEKIVIKVFLLYEYLNNTQIMMSALPEIFVEENNFYIMSIQDIEMLFATYKTDFVKFNEVVDDLINRGDKRADNKSVLYILNKHGIKGNLHFINERDYFQRVIDNLDKDLKNNGDDMRYGYIWND